jgi:hypothetical protein
LLTPRGMAPKTKPYDALQSEGHRRFAAEQRARGSRFFRMSLPRIALHHRTYGFMDLCVGSFEHLLGIANQRIHCGGDAAKTDGCDAD